MVGVGVGEGCRRRLVALLVLALHRTEKVAFLPFQFAGGEAVLVGALDLLEYGAEARLDTVRLDPRREGDDVQGFDVWGTSGAGVDVWRFGGLAALEQARIQHHEREPLHHRAPERVQVAARFGVELADEYELGCGRFGVREDLDDRGTSWPGTPVSGLSVASPAAALGCAGVAFRRRREVLLYPGLDGFHVEVAHGDDGHQVGPVPTVVVGTQALHRGVLDDLNEADGGAAGIERVAE